MKKINVLILDDNERVSTEILLKLHLLSKKRHPNSAVELCPFHLTIDNVDVKNAAKSVNTFVYENEINFLLLDRGFSHIIDPQESGTEKYDTDYLYKDNSKGGFYIEDLLIEWNSIKNTTLNTIKGAIIYTYDDFRDDGKKGDVVKNEILSRIVDGMPTKCHLEVFLTFSDIYENSKIDLYVGFKKKGVIKMGKKNEFMLYGAFVGEILYYKMMCLVAIRSQQDLIAKRTKVIYRIFVLFPVFISINIGSSAIYDSIKANLTYELTIGLICLFFGVMIPLLILFLKPSVLIDLEEI